MTAQDKIQQFKNELSELLLKYNAELITENKGNPYTDNHQIYVEFEWDYELFKKFESGFISELELGYRFDGKEY